MKENGEINVVESRPDCTAMVEAALDVYDRNRALKLAQLCASEGKALNVESFCLLLAELCNLLKSFGKVCYSAFSGKLESLS
jgi:hypothetical protein